MKKKKEITWTFPQRKVFGFRGESATVALLGLIILIVSWAQLRNIFFAIGLSALFIAIYIILSYGIHSIRDVKETYKLTKTHFQVTRKTRWKQKKEKVAWKDVTHHNIDHTFLGGYMLSKKGKHLLFFNTKEELKKLKKFLKI